MTDDLISRQAILDAVDGVTWYHQNENGEMVHGANSAEHQAWYKAEDIYAAIEALPPAQPGCEDTVYRKAVQMLLAYFVPEERYAEAVDGLRRLPSAQPERKGKWVGVGYDGDWLKTMCKCSKCGAMIDINEKYRNFFCYHCGARMDGEQDERLNQQTGGS